MSLRTTRNSIPLWCITYKEYEYDPEAWHDHWLDAFDDGVIDYEWMSHNVVSPGRTVVENAPPDETLIIAVLNGTPAKWFNPSNQAPKIYVPLNISAPCRITTKINSIDGDPPGDINDCTAAGIFIGIDPEGVSTTAVYKWMYERNDGSAYNGLRLRRNDASYPEEAGILHPICPIWLRINITEDNFLHFEYSKDGITYLEYSHLVPELYADYIDTCFVGIYAENNVGTYCMGNIDVSANFEFFLIEIFEARRPTISECYAPIDVRSPVAFYDGRIQSMATLKRAIDDNTGLFQVADMNLTLKNTDKHFSNLITKRILKDQEATLYHAWTDEPEDNKRSMVTMIIDDYSLKGTDFTIKLKDISQKYFTQQVPADICTEEFYEFISDNHKGRCKPEVLGRAYLPWATPPPYEHNGAVEAVYIDTTSGRFIAANRPLRDITEVFLDDVPQTEGAGDDYIWYIFDGDTYIDFTPGSLPTIDEVVTFNAEGYFRDAWNSGNGYIQNPAYIMLFYLRFIMGIPASLIDFPAFATLAQYYVNISEEESFYLILQAREDAMEILRQMLFSAGAKAWINLEGKLTIARKDVSDWEIASTEYHLIEQTDLIGVPDRKWNMPSAINTVNIEYGYIPWLNIFKDATSEYRENPFDRPMERDTRDRQRRE